MDEQAFTLTLELAKSKKVREETEDRCAEELGRAIEVLEGLVLGEKKNLEDSTSRMTEALQ